MRSVDQFAFLKTPSTLSSFHRVIDDWYEALNKGEYVGACFLDISKCFDAIDHDLSVFKLQCCGLIDNEVSWFKSYLIGTSAPKDVTMGIPQ